MARENVLLNVVAKVTGERSIDKLTRRLTRLNDIVTGYGNRISKTLDTSDTKWKKHFDFVDKMVKGMGFALTKFVGMSAKFATIQVGALGIAMMAVHAAFVLGNASMKVFRGAAQIAAGAAAGLTIALAAASAAIREQQAAMFAYRGTGKNEFGSGINQIRVQMRGLMNDASLAALGTENLNAAFAAMARGGNYTQSSQALFRGLMDFASAGQDIKTGSKAAAELVAALTDPKANFTKISEAAKALGPEMEQALNKAKEKGVDTASELRAAILDGSLAVLGGVEGQFDTFNSTLINRGKAVFSQIREMFTDMGQPYLEPLKKELQEISIIIRMSLLRAFGDIEAFAQGNFIDNISVVVENVADFFVKMIHDYLPKVDGMFNRMGEWWANFKDGWNIILNTLRPLIDAARVLEKMLMEILRPVGDLLGEGFMELRNLIVDNEKEFVLFGSSVGKFIQEFSNFASSLREIFVDALPFLTKIVDGATALFDIFTSILGVVKQLTGGLGDFGPFALIAGLVGAGRGMKNTIGGAIPNLKSMNVNAQQVVVSGMTPAGLVAQPGGGYLPPPTIGTGAGPGMRSLGAPPPPPPPPSPQVSRGGFFQPGYTERMRGQGGVMPPMLFPNLRANMRSRRDTRFSAMMFGNEALGIKGINKSATGAIGASLGLGLLSNVAGPEAQGALALGSTIGMFNPMAGLAVGLGGAALTSTTAGGGALAGAGAGATIGSVMGPAGAIGGALIGAAVGGIMGAFNRDKKKKAEARKAGEQAMNDLTGSVLDGIRDTVIKLGPSALTTGNVGKQFDSIRTAIDETISGARSLVEAGSDDESLRSWMERGRASGNLLLSGMTESQFQDAMEKPREALEQMLETDRLNAAAADNIEQLYMSRLPYLSDTLGLTEEAIIELANSTGTNLFDATKSTTEMIKTMAEGMVDSFRDVQLAAGQILADISMIFETPLQMREGMLAFDENMRNIYDTIQQGGLVGEEGRMQLLASLQNALPQILQAKGGDQISALFEFIRSFDPNNPESLFSQANGPLTGQADLFRSLVGEELGAALTSGREQLSSLIGEYLTANLLGAELQLGEGQRRAIQNVIAGNVANQSLSESEFNELSKFLETADLKDQATIDQLETMLFTMTGVKTTIDKIQEPIDLMAEDFSSATEQYRLASEAIINAFGPPPDTRSPRAIGDTGVNLSNTLSAHNSISSRISGKRVITSSYRNFALGSLNSDHLTGNALDLVGDNLVSYRDAVNKSGGFAEFHGGFGSGRHLHVVPGMGAIGDNGTQMTTTTASAPAGGQVTVNNTFNISGQNGQTEELVQTIIARINSSIRDARERS